MKEKNKQKCFIQLTLLMLIIGGLFFVAQPTQAGFFDWFSSTWYKTQSIFIKEQVQESLPASISEPIKEMPLPEETIPKTSALEIQETSEEIRPVATSEAAASEKVIYRDNPEQEITIKNLRNQITSLQNQIKNLEKQIEDLLSKSPEIKIITKEIPVEKIVVREIIKEVPKEKIIIKEVPVEKVVIKEVIKEVPVEKIVTKEVLVPQTCPACQSCQACSSSGEKKTIDISRIKIIAEPSSTSVSIRINGIYIQGETLPRLLALATFFYWETNKPTEVREMSVPIEYARNDTYQYIRSNGPNGISNLYPETMYNYYVEFKGAGLTYEGIIAKTGVGSFTTLEPRIIIIPSPNYNAIYDSGLNLWKLPIDLSVINEFSSSIALRSFIFEFEPNTFEFNASIIPRKIELRKREGYDLLTEQTITDLTSVYGNTGYGGYPKTFSFATTQMTYPAYLEPDPRGVLYYKFVFYFDINFGDRANRISGSLVLNSLTADVNGTTKSFTTSNSNDFRFSFMVNK